MHYAMIMAGGSGTRPAADEQGRTTQATYPFHRREEPAAPALDRFEGMIPSERRYVCAGLSHRQAILSSIPSLSPCAVSRRADGPRHTQCGRAARRCARRERPRGNPGGLYGRSSDRAGGGIPANYRHGFFVGRAVSNALVTFGIEPTGPTTGYGYDSGDPIDDTARVVLELSREAAPCDRGGVREVGAGALLAGNYPCGVRPRPGLHWTLRAGRPCGPSRRGPRWRRPIVTRSYSAFIRGSRRSASTSP